MAATWTPADLPDLRGRTVIVTGASSGIGAETARGLAGAGAHVVLAVRDVAKGERVAAAVAGDTVVSRLDLADLTSVREFAATWAGSIDVLINNAGIMAVPARRTADGFEAQIGTNHLGHFALTMLLSEHLSGRVVTVSSVAARSGMIDFDDLNFDRRRYKRWSAYAQSKLANLLFTFELDRRLRAAGSDVLAVAAHPGLAGTNLFSAGLLQKSIGLLARPFAGDAGQGALPTLFAATEDLFGGAYVGPDGATTTQRAPVMQAPPPRATDPVVAAALWELSATLTDIPADLSVG